MKPRLTAWLTLLLAISALFGVPTARIAIQAACYQISCEQVPPRGEEQVIVAERRRPVRVAEVAPAQEPFRSTVVAHPLRQRPPPASL